MTTAIDGLMKFFSDDSRRSRLEYDVAMLGARDIEVGDLDPGEVQTLAARQKRLDVITARMNRRTAFKPG